MAKKLDLRTKAAPSAQTVAEAPVNQLPFPPGEKMRLMPEEIDFLKSAGWQEGDPVPDLKAFMASVAKEQAKAVSDLETSGATPSAPEMLNFEDLPPEKQQELTQAFEELRETQEVQPIQAPPAPEMAAPGVAEAIEVASQEDGLEVVDDPSQAVEPEVTPEPDPTGVRLPASRSCDHCGWDLNNKLVPVTTNTDKRDFLASILGGTRFYKDVHLFGESVTVRYRTLRTEEADIALQQASFDFRDGKIPDQGEFYRIFTNYRLAMSIEQISTPGAVHIVPAIGDIEWDVPAQGEPAQTAAPALEAWLHANVLASESMRRVVGLEHQRFQRLVEKLEARVDDSDFWKGIASGL
jgi:hypothetical protein